MDLVRGKGTSLFIVEDNMLTVRTREGLYHPPSRGTWCWENVNSGYIILQFNKTIFTKHELINTLECVAAYTQRPLYPITCGKGVDTYFSNLCSPWQGTSATFQIKSKRTWKIISSWLISGDVFYCLMRQMFFLLNGM